MIKHLGTSLRYGLNTEEVNKELKVKKKSLRLFYGRNMVVETVGNKAMFNIRQDPKLI